MTPPYIVSFRVIMAAMAFTAGSMTSSYLPLKAFYHKCGRQKVQAKIQTLEITGDGRFCSTYNYTIEQQQYIGHRLFDDEVKMDWTTLQAIRAKIIKDSVIEVYYMPDDPSSSIAFLNERAITFPGTLYCCAIFSWLFLGGIYIRANYVDKKGCFRFN